jgi:hypothetical protein
MYDNLIFMIIGHKFLSKFCIEFIKNKYLSHIFNVSDKYLTHDLYIYFFGTMIFIYLSVTNITKQILI